MASFAEQIAEPLVAPENFAMVFPGVYRSGFPKKRHFPFLRKIGVRTILTLVLEEYPSTNVVFNEENGVTLMQFAVPGNKEPSARRLLSERTPHSPPGRAMLSHVER